MKKITLILLSIGIFISGIYSYNVIKGDNTNISNKSNAKKEKKQISIFGTIPYKNTNDLIVDSAVIIKGKVDDILESKWSNPDKKRGEAVRNVLQTDVAIKVDKVFKGTPYSTDKIIVRIDKGETDTVKVESDCAPEFKKGEEVVLFLIKDDTSLAVPNENYYILTGMMQGKYKLNKKGNVKDEFTMDCLGRNEKIELSDFSNKIESTLKEYEKSGVKKLTKEEIREINKKTVGE